MGKPSLRDASNRPGQCVLCLSGGGYRAMLFHLGVVWRLNEFGYLPRLNRISSVSGGSILAGLLGLRWTKLAFDAGTGRAPQANVLQHVIAPIRKLASTTIDWRAGLKGIFWRGMAAKHVAAVYNTMLFQDATLQDFPEDDHPGNPRFVINATNTQSGVLWRFSRPYMRDYRVGKIACPTTPLAEAVAASSAFPPVLAPFLLRLKPADFVPGSGQDLQKDPYMRLVVLSDGGVYDNLGLETAITFDTILVSDGGGVMKSKDRPWHNYFSQLLRTRAIQETQTRSLRKRELLDAYTASTRNGTYWSIRTNIRKYAAPDKLPAPVDDTLTLANLDTRLKALCARTQERLINWGYAICDAGMRTWVDPALPRPDKFPYTGGVSL